MLQGVPRAEIVFSPSLESVESINSVRSASSAIGAAIAIADRARNAVIFILALLLTDIDERGCILVEYNDG